MCREFKLPSFQQQERKLEFLHCMRFVNFNNLFELNVAIVPLLPFFVGRSMRTNELLKQVDSEIQLFYRYAINFT